MSTNRPAQVDADPSSVAGATVPDARQRRSILVAVCIALMAVIASVSGLNVAQPDLAVAFDASQSTILWIINIYTLSLAALLLPLGAVGDRWGRKPVLLAGLNVFGVASTAAGLAPSAEVILAARVLSGVGAAMIMPVTLAVITSTFPEQERGRAIGTWTGVAGGGGILGMFLSAALVDVAN
jgi:MFS family permease